MSVYSQFRLIERFLDKEKFSLATLFGCSRINYIWIRKELLYFNVEIKKSSAAAEGKYLDSFWGEINIFALSNKNFERNKLLWTSFLLLDLGYSIWSSTLFKRTILSWRYYYSLHDVMTTTRHTTVVNIFILALL